MKDNLNKKDAALEADVPHLSLEEIEEGFGLLISELGAFESDEPKLKFEDEDELTHPVDNETSPSFKGGEGFKALDGEKAEGEPDFAFNLDGVNPSETDLGDFADEVGGEGSVEYIAEDDLFFAVARLVVEEGVTSVSYLQRSFGIGYEKAANIVIRLEELAIVSPQDGNRPRKVLVSAERLEKILASL